MDKRKLIMGLLWDVGLPAVVFYVGRALGFAALPALVAAGLLVCWALWYRGRRQRAVAAGHLTPPAESERPRARSGKGSANYQPA
jgi:hypothetical protein